jgi:hypothetical protein
VFVPIGFLDLGEDLVGFFKQLLFGLGQDAGLLRKRPTDEATPSLAPQMYGDFSHGS